MNWRVVSLSDESMFNRQWNDDLQDLHASKEESASFSIIESR